MKLRNFAQTCSTCLEGPYRKNSSGAHPFRAIDRAWEPRIPSPCSLTDDTRQRCQALPSVKRPTLGKVLFFAECRRSWLSAKTPPLPSVVAFDTRQSLHLCRVSGLWHSAKAPPLPSVVTHSDTRQKLLRCWVLSLWHSAKALCRVLWPWHSEKCLSLPSAMVIALGKSIEFFFFFFSFILSIHIHSHITYIFTDHIHSHIYS